MAALEGRTRIFWTLSAILCMTVSTVHSVCDQAEAQACINSQTEPSNQEECVIALSTLLDTVTCVELQTENCTEEERATLTTNLQSKQAAISAQCGDANCPSFGEKWPKYRKCLVQYNLADTMDAIKTEWVKPSSVLSTMQMCRDMAAINRCLRDNSANCQRLREDLGALYVDIPSLKQHQDICGLETYPTASSGPIIAECDRDVNTVVNQLKADCPFNFDYGQTDSGAIISACVEMQVQINCVLQQQRTCPLAVTKYLKPRMEAYGIANHIFCGNVTLNGLTIKPISFPGYSCDYNNVVGCFNVMYSIFGRSAVINGPNLLHFFRWNVFDNTTYCDGFASYNATSTQLCIQPNIEYCTIPFPTYGIVPINLSEDFDMELYDILSSGPVPINRFGAKFIADQRNFVCYGGCENRESLSSALANTCKPDLLNKAAAVVADTASGTPTCSDFVMRIECAANASVTCPLLLRPVLDIFDTANVAEALKICNASEPVLLPSNYHPTRPKIYPTTQYTYSTTSYVPPRTTLVRRATTSTTIKPDGSISTSSDELMSTTNKVSAAGRVSDRKWLTEYAVAMGITMLFYIHREC